MKRHHGRKKSTKTASKKTEIQAASARLWSNLERLRVKLGATHHDLAGLLGLSSARYHSLKNGERHLPLIALVALANCIGMSLQDFVRGEFKDSQVRKWRKRMAAAQKS